MGSILGWYFIRPGVFFGQINIKTLSSCSWEIAKKSFRGKLLKIFHFSTLRIWLLGIFDKHPQGCDEVKNFMGILHGPRLMAWTTKSPIRGNHWVPSGCRAHLGSVKVVFGRKKHSPRKNPPSTFMDFQKKIQPPRLLILPLLYPLHVYSNLHV